MGIKAAGECRKTGFPWWVSFGSKVTVDMRDVINLVAGMEWKNILIKYITEGKYQWKNGISLVTAKYRKATQHIRLVS